MEPTSAVEVMVAISICSEVCVINGDILDRGRKKMASSWIGFMSSGYYQLLAGFASTPTRPALPFGCKGYVNRR